MEAERYASHVIDPKTVTTSGETTPTDTINRADGACRANARFIRPFDLGEHTFMEKRSIVNQPTGCPKIALPHQTTKPSQRLGQCCMTGLVFAP
jgi:hypothetical protein